MEIQLKENVFLETILKVPGDLQKQENPSEDVITQEQEYEQRENNLIEERITIL